MAKSNTNERSMNAQTQRILDEALALPDAERALLLERLLESTSQEEEEMTEDELFAELERRHAEFEHDPSVAIPWSEVQNEE
jgi:putative addiction module component (TIGR02574 family)